MSKATTDAETTCKEKKKNRASITTGDSPLNSFYILLSFDLYSWLRSLSLSPVRTCDFVAFLAYSKHSPRRCLSAQFSGLHLDSHGLKVTQMAGHARNIL